MSYSRLRVIAVWSSCSWLSLPILMGMTAFGCTSNSKSSAPSDAPLRVDDAALQSSDAKGADGSYANIVGVSVSGAAGARSFAVSIESADTGCSRYANWWEILAQDGTLIYRRILGHSHTDANGTTDPDAPGNTFTRSSTQAIDVADIDILYVRAHMNDVGYVGRFMTGSVDQGFTVATELPADFAAKVEIQAPQPSGCAF